MSLSIVLWPYWFTTLVKGKEVMQKQPKSRIMLTLNNKLIWWHVKWTFSLILALSHSREFNRFRSMQKKSVLSPGNPVPKSNLPTDQCSRENSNAPVGNWALTIKSIAHNLADWAIIMIIKSLQVPYLGATHLCTKFTDFNICAKFLEPAFSPVYHLDNFTPLMWPCWHWLDGNGFF